MQANEGSAFHGGGPLGHVGHGRAALIELLLSGHGAHGHTGVGQLHADLGRVGDLAVKRVERQHVLAADGHRFFANTQNHLIDVGVVGLLLGNERHLDKSPLLMFFVVFFYRFSSLMIPASAFFTGASSGTWELGFPSQSKA